MLAKLHRSGELEAINVPDTEDESIRDLCRARTAAIIDLRSNRFRLKAFLLRNGYKYHMKTAWTPSHMAYIRGLTFKDEAQKMIVEEYLMIIDQIEDRIERYDNMIETLSNTWRWKPVVKALMSMKGVKLLTAVTIMAELGDIRRFKSPRQLMSFLGLTATEYSSGEGRSQGAISKSGNSHARRFLVESAQHYKNTPKISQNLSRRQEGIPAEIKEIAWNAQVRLHKRYWALVNKGKNNNQPLQDMQVKRLLDKLEEMGELDNTFILFTSDNGPHSENKHNPHFFDSSNNLKGHKRDMYEGGVRVPGIVYWPGKSVQGLSDHPAIFYDVMPTIAEVAGVDAPKQTDGISFLPEVLGKNQRKHVSLYWELQTLVPDEKGNLSYRRATRKGDWKAVRYEDKGSTELYNINTDLYEKNDVAKQHPEIVQNLEKLIMERSKKSPYFPQAGKIIE